jgi:hypothetical protein
MKKMLKGVFTLKKFDLEGNLIEEFEELNLIVDKARFNMARLISASTNPYYISSIGFGLGTTDADVADLVLTSSITKGFDSITYPDATSVQFNWSLDETEGNGMAITEFGLLSNNGDLFARKVRAAINKEADFTLTGAWKIFF